MTRKKKTRSLKSIHNVKTGNISKLKRAGTTDRQNSNLKTKAKPKSVYQKFLEENPEAAEKAIQVANSQSQNTPTESISKTSPSSNNTITKDETSSKKKSKKDDNREDTRQDSRAEKEPDLLSQLDNKNFNDFY